MPDGSTVGCYRHIKKKIKQISLVERPHRLS